VDQDLDIPIQQLRAAFERILNYIELEGSTVALEHDYFWSIPPDELYNAYERPTSITIGQISESWQHVMDMLDGKSDIIRYHLTWLSDVLRAIGQDARSA
jgi:hypothetical protein